MYSPSREHPDWPRIRIVPLEAAPDVPTEVAHRFLEPGVPQDFLNGAYSALGVVRWLPAHGGDRLVVFGLCPGEVDWICLDMSTGTIVEIVAPGLLPRLWHVNASLDLFVACLSAVTARLPFYSDEDKIGNPAYRGELLAQAGNELAKAIDHIDPSALAQGDGFWRRLVDGVAAGNCSIEEILNR